MEEKKQEGIEALQNLKAFVDSSQAIDDVQKNVENYNQAKKQRVLILFDGMIADIESNKKLFLKR